MKVCSKCTTEKPLDDFNKSSARPDGRQNYCRSCNSGVGTGYYARNKEVQRPKVRARNVSIKERNRQHVLAYLTTHPCVDCGEDDLRVLEFDHLKDKDRSVSRMISEGYGLARIDTEIAKCEVVCSNCHKKRTYSRNPSYRSAGYT